MQTYQIIAMGVLILAGAFLGYFGIWFFNKMPASWLADYGEEPPHEEGQRIKTYPWKYAFVSFMVIAGVKLSFGDIYIALGSLMALWALLLMSFADKKYMIVPDQLIVVLLLSAIGFVSHYSSFKEPLFGGLIAFAAIGLMALIGKVLLKKWVIGGADLKIYAALGIILGWKGFVIIFIVTSLLSALHFAFLLINKKAKREDERPLVPYIFVATSLYLLVLYPGINEILL